MLSVTEVTAMVRGAGRTASGMGLVVCDTTFEIEDQLGTSSAVLIAK